MSGEVYNDLTWSKFEMQLMRDYLPARKDCPIGMMVRGMLRRYDRYPDLFTLLPRHAANKNQFNNADNYRVISTPLGNKLLAIEAKSSINFSRKGREKLYHQLERISHYTGVAVDVINSGLVEFPNEIPIAQLQGLMYDSCDPMTNRIVVPDTNSGREFVEKHDGLLRLGAGVWSLDILKPEGTILVASRNGTMELPVDSSIEAIFQFDTLDV